MEGTLGREDFRRRFASRYSPPAGVDPKLWEEYLELVSEVAYHDYRYYTLDDPVISDQEYDRLYQRLRELEEAHPELVIPDSPTQRVGGEVRDELPTVKHPYPMLSLENAFDFGEVDRHLERIGRLLIERGHYSSLDQVMEELELVCELKYDGLSIVLHYERGRLAYGATRGNGYEGEDVTHNVRTIRSLPLELSEPVTVWIRGEVYMNRVDFEEVNRRRREEGLPLYANPRNLAAGTMRQLDSSIAARRNLRCFTYEIQNWREVGVSTHWEALERLRAWGLPVNPLNRLVRGRDELLAVLSHYEQVVGELPYECDGVVIKVNWLAWHEELGYTAKSPRFALAYKFAVEEAETTLREVEWSLGRTGVLTPVAIFDPVQLSGTVVKRASLHNLDEMARLGLLRGELPGPEHHQRVRATEVRAEYALGARIRVKKSGEIIPQVISADTGGPEVEWKPLPRYWVGGRATWEPSSGAVELEVTIQPHYLFLPSLATEDLLIKRLIYFASRSCMDIEGMSRKTAEKLVHSGLVSSIPDLYRLQVEDVEGLEGFARKSAENLIEAIERSKERPFERVLTALGIPEVGSQTALLLARHFKNIDRLMAASLEELEVVEGVGPIIAKHIVDFFADPQNRELVEELRGLGLSFEYEEPAAALEEEASDFFRGKTVVVTGTIEGISRDQIHRLIELNGGRASSSVSRKTDLLIVGENPGSKLDKARALGVPTMSGEEFLELLSRERFILDEELASLPIFASRARA